jgi:hypothetical protein
LDTACSFHFGDTLEFALLQQALLIAESSHNKVGVAETEWNLAQTGFYVAKMSASLPHAQEARMLYAALGNRTREVGCLCVIAKASIDGGQLARRDQCSKGGTRDERSSGRHLGAN